MERINNAAADCQIESGMIRSERMQNAIAKFYIAVFLLLADVAKWYNSSSWKKFRNSLHENFHQAYAQRLQTVERLSATVRRVADAGTAAEVRVTRLTLQELQTEIGDLRAGLEGRDRERAELARQYHEEQMKQHERTREQDKLNHDETRQSVVDQLSQLLRSQTFNEEIAKYLIAAMRKEAQRDAFHDPILVANLQMSPGHATTAASDLPTARPENKAGAPDAGSPNIGQLQRFAERLLDYVPTGSVGVEYSDAALESFFDVDLVVAVEEWVNTGSSRLKYMESSAISTDTPDITLVARRVVLAADALKLPTIAFFCELPAEDGEDEERGALQSGGPDEEAPLLGLVYSLTYQILSLLPPQDQQDKIQSEDRVRTLDGSPSCWGDALTLFKDVLSLAPPWLMCVVDAISSFEEGQEQEMRDLVAAFREAAEAPGKMLKVLFTCSQTSFCLLEELNADELEIIASGGPASGLTGRRGGGKGAKRALLVA